MEEGKFYKSLEEKLHVIEAKRLRLRFWFISLLFVYLFACAFGLGYLYDVVGLRKEKLLAFLAVISLFIPLSLYFHLQRRWSRVFKGEFLPFLFKNFFQPLNMKWMRIYHLIFLLQVCCL